MRFRLRSTLAAVSGVLIATTACASTSNQAARTALVALKAPPSTVASGPTTTTAPVPKCDPTASYAPLPSEPIPVPNQMPAGTFMRTILDRQKLVIGIDENTKYYSYRDPSDGKFYGFEVDLARKLAESIFGDPTKVEFVTVVTAQKVPFVEQRKVDATISVVSASCERWQQVAFSTTYYTTTQRIMVRNGSKIEGSADLAGRRVCVTSGSSSEKYLADSFPDAEAHPVEARTDCLVALEENRVDAVLLPNSILVGLQAQDPNTHILDEILKSQYYGIPISKDHPEFVRFVNALLEQWRNDGTLAGLEEKWLPPELRTPVPQANYLP